MPARQNILKRVVQRMAQMQGRGDVRRRDDDRIGFAGIGRLCVEKLLVVPHAQGFKFHRGGFVSFGELGAHGVRNFGVEISI